MYPILNILSAPQGTSRQQVKFLIYKALMEFCQSIRGHYPILDVLGEVTIAPLTSTIRRIPSEVVLTSEDGLPKVCAINLDHVQTVSKAKVGSFITALSDSQMDRVKNALLFALGF